MIFLEGNKVISIAALPRTNSFLLNTEDKNLSAPRTLPAFMGHSAGYVTTSGHFLNFALANIRVVWLHFARYDFCLYLILD